MYYLIVYNLSLGFEPKNGCSAYAIIGKMSDEEEAMLITALIEGAEQQSKNAETSD